MRNLLKTMLFVCCCTVTALVHAVDFSFVDMNGKTHHSADYRGKWMVVNFWASWCPPCLSEMPELSRFHDKHRGHDAVVIGINQDDLSPDELKTFATKKSISYPLAPTNEEIHKIFGSVFGLPTTVLVSPEGELVASEEGEIDGASIEQFISDYERQAKKEPSRSSF